MTLHQVRRPAGVSPAEQEGHGERESGAGGDQAVSRRGGGGSGVVQEGDNRIIQAGASSPEVQEDALPGGGGHVQQAQGHVHALQGLRPRP